MDGYWLPDDLDQNSSKNEKFEFRNFLEPNELLQAGTMIRKVHFPNAEFASRDVATGQSEEQKIEYSTWKRHAESENPARRLAHILPIR